MTETQIKMAALCRRASEIHKDEVVENSGLDVTRLSVLVQEIHRMARDAGLSIEVLATPTLPKPFDTTTLRIMSQNLCVLSRTYA